MLTLHTFILVLVFKKYKFIKIEQKVKKQIFSGYFINA